MKLFICALAITVFGAVSAADGPASYPRLVKKYHLQTSHKESWFKALHYCSSRGMRLASITSREENNRLVKQLKDAHAGDNFWVAGTNLGSKPHFYWMSQEKALEFTDWHNKEPSNPDGVENCIELRKAFDYQWNDNRCDHRFHFICEEQTLQSDFRGTQSLHDIFDLPRN